MVQEIAAQDARALFTTMLVDVYRDRLRPKSFLRSLFKTKESTTKNVSIEVRRGKERVAVDVARGSEGNMNDFSKSTMKIFEPAYYREYFNATALDLYDRMFGSGNVDMDIFTQFMDDVVEKLSELQDLIDRAYELQCSQVLHTGILELKAATNIDFKRKAESMVDLGAGNYWNDSGVDVNTSLKAACTFLRTIGKAGGGIFNLILGEDALDALLNNDAVKDRAKFVQYGLDQIQGPLRDAVGSTFHGELSVGSYKVRLWGYPEFYDKKIDETTVESTPYIDPKTAILLPLDPHFVMAYAAVPQLLKPGSPVKKGAYLASEYVDERADAHVMDLKSAGVAVPVAVDQIYTMQVLATA